MKVSFSCDMIFYFLGFLLTSFSVVLYGCNFIVLGVRGVKPRTVMLILKTLRASLLCMSQGSLQLVLNPACTV